MRTLLTNAAASCLNFAGRGAKTGVADMRILNVVVGEFVK